MANIVEASPPVYPVGVYQIEDGDPADGGPTGTFGAPLVALANRTKYLKSRVDLLETGLDTHDGAGGTAHALATTVAAGFMSSEDKAKLDALALVVPVGTVIHVIQETAPAGYVIADGSALAIADYPGLYAVIGVRFGSGTGTFRVPDLRGEFIRGLDLGRGVDPNRVIGSHQTGSLIVGDFNSDASVAGFGLATAVGTGGVQNDVGLDTMNGADYPHATATGLGAGGTMYPAGGGADIYGVARPRNVALTPCIKF